MLDLQLLRITSGASLWSLPSLDSGESTTFLVTGVLKPKPGKQIRVIGITFSNTDDPDLNNNRAKFRTTGS